MSNKEQKLPTEAVDVERSGLLADEKSYGEELAKELCELTDALGCPVEQEDSHENSLNRIRDLVAAEGKLGDCEELLRECWEQLPDSIGNSRIRSGLLRLGVISG